MIMSNRQVGAQSKQPVCPAVLMCANAFHPTSVRICAVACFELSYCLHILHAVLPNKIYLHESQELVNGAIHCQACLKRCCLVWRPYICTPWAVSPDNSNWAGL